MLPISQKKKKHRVMVRMHSYNQGGQSPRQNLTPVVQLEIGPPQHDPAFRINVIRFGLLGLAKNKRALMNRNPRERGSSRLSDGRIHRMIQHNGKVPRIIQTRCCSQSLQWGFHGG